MTQVPPTMREPKGDHNRRLSLGLEPDDFAREAGVTVDQLRDYERTAPDHDFDLEVEKRWIDWKPIPHRPSAFATDQAALSGRPSAMSSARSCAGSLNQTPCIPNLRAATMFCSLSSMKTQLSGARP
jgi:hypothetical protein